ncbi:MAG TPA: hypothetical protein VHV78_04985, partial [Gemmatimonadaceae bacterium]|nr:hypothetical protein [Gemmatimonadaceae bacterium]
MEVLQKQVADQAASGAQSRSRASIEITGRVVVNAFSNERRVNNVDDPQFVRRDTTSSVPEGGMGMAIRQTMLGLRTTVSDVAGGTFRGVIDADFYGVNSRPRAAARFRFSAFRTAHGTLHWDNFEILAGQ